MRSTSVILCALLCCSLSSATLFDDELRELTEFLRLQMQCGYPKLGIPVLAPAQMAFKSIDLKTDKSSCKGNFTDLSIVGLDGFEFFKLKWSNILHTITFDMNFPRIHLKSANYKLDIMSQLFGSGMNLWGDGVLELELLNLRGNGSFVIRPSSVSSGTYVKKWNVDWQLGKSNSNITGIMGKSNVIHKMFNKIIEDFFDLLINDNPEEISQFIEQLVVPPLNGVLENVAWYEITAVILGLVKGLLPIEPIC